MEEDLEESGSRFCVSRLIERATDSTAPEVEPRLLKAIKSAVRTSDMETRLAVRSLMDLMKKTHSQVRYLSVLIIDELFMRSKLFRTLFVVNFDQYLTLSIGFRKNLPLPPPSSIASKLRKNSISFLEKWNATFGIHYRQLRLGFDYLKNTLKFNFPNNIENAARLQHERRERELRTREILLSKFETLKENFSSIKSEIGSTVDEIKECLEIINVKREELNPNPSLDFTNGEDEEMGGFTSLEMRQIRLDSLKEGETVHETVDNKAVFDTLRELNKLLISKHLVSVQDWISVLIRVDLADNRFRDSALKELIDIRNQIQSIMSKLSQFGSVLDYKEKRVLEKEEQEEEDLWEEGKIETNLNENESKLNENESKLNENESNSNQNETNLDPERSKLLAEAPIVNWSPFLDNWGSKREILANQRGLELEGHWGRVDYDRVIPAERIAELNVHRTVYTEEPTEIKPCLTPLKNGTLCQRRDLRICPFHGKIISRDEKGNPVNVNKNEEEDEEGRERLFKQAVGNVRRREREEKLLKRAKLARVREHNEGVLREAAIASTSYSMESFRDRGEIKREKVGLSSMLKKKVTAKDRIAKKML